MSGGAIAYPPTAGSLSQGRSAVPSLDRRVWLYQEMGDRPEYQTWLY